MADNPRQLLSAEALGNLAKANGLGWFNPEHVMALWSAAILRADVVVALAPVQRQGLELIEATDGRYTHVLGSPTRDSSARRSWKFT